MRGFNKVAMAVGLGVLLVGCSGDEPATESTNANTAVEASVPAEPIKAEKAAKAEETKAAGVPVTPQIKSGTVKDPGKTDATNYVDPEFLDIYHAYHQITGLGDKISEWSWRDAPSLGMKPTMIELAKVAKTWRESSIGAFEKRDLEGTWEASWEAALAEHTPPKHLRIELAANFAVKYLTTYDFDKAGFHVELGRGATSKSELESIVNWDVGGYGYGIVNVPTFISVTDESMARRIEDLRRDSDLIVKIYGGIVEAKSIERYNTEYRTVIADYHFAELTTGAGEILLTF